MAAGLLDAFIGYLGRFYDSCSELRGELSPRGDDFCEVLLLSASTLAGYCPGFLTEMLCELTVEGFWYDFGAIGCCRFTFKYSSIAFGLMVNIFFIS